MNTKTVIKLTTTQHKLYESLNTKSDKIRMLDSLGYSRSLISKYIQIRYQHVRNVLITPIKNPNKFKK